MVACKRPPRRLYGYDVAYSEVMPRKDLGGLNCYAARDPANRLPFPFPCSTIQILRDQSCKKIDKTVLHEALEANAMKRLKLPYRRAHRLVTKLEKMVVER